MGTENTLVIGMNSRIASIFKYFSNSIYLLVKKTPKPTDLILDEVAEFQNIKEKAFNKPTITIKKIFIVSNIVKEKQITIIVTNTKNDLIITKLALLFLKNKPTIICTFHNSYAFSNKQKTKLLACLIKKCSSGCICLSKSVYNQLNEYKDLANKIIYQPNIIESTYFNKKHDFEIKNSINIIYVARIDSSKNQMEILESLKIIKKNYRQNFNVDFYGEILDQEYYELLLSYVKANDLTGIRFKGKVSQKFLKNNICKYDLYISSSKKEMSPYNVLEAMSAMVPIIASDVSGNNDLVKDGASGFLYKLGDYNDLSKCIIHVLKMSSSERLNIAKNALNFVENDNSALNVSKIMENFICKIRL